MNIFFVDTDPRLAARMLCDRHIVKMVTESAQILSAVQRKMGVDDPALYKIPGGNPKPVEWAIKSRQNYDWLLIHWASLTRQYHERFERWHAAGAYTNNGFTKLGNVLFDYSFPGRLPDIGLTVPECSTKDYVLPYTHADTWEKVVDNYRSYYLIDKVNFARWEHGVPAPYWWVFSSEEERI